MKKCKVKKYYQKVTCKIIIAPEIYQRIAKPQKGEMLREKDEPLKIKITRAETGKQLIINYT